MCTHTGFYAYRPKIPTWHTIYHTYNKYIVPNPKSNKFHLFICILITPINLCPSLTGRFYPISKTQFTSHKLNLILKNHCPRHSFSHSIPFITLGIRYLVYSNYYYWYYIINTNTSKCTGTNSWLNFSLLSHKYIVSCICLSVNWK